MKVAIVIEVTIPINVERVDDSIIVIIYVNPVIDAVTIPIVELGIGGSLSVAARVRAYWVWICNCWAVPCCDYGGFVKWEGVVLICDLVII